VDLPTGDTEEGLVVAQTEETRPEETHEEDVSRVAEEFNGLVEDNRPHPEEMQEMQVDEAGRVKETNCLE